MTSSSNHTIIEDYLVQNRYFGLKKNQIHLFKQDNAPFVDDQGNWIIDGSGNIASGPDGNGHALRKLMKSGIGAEWKKQGIESLIVLPIDNPLADPFDATSVDIMH
jgi:UDP-N-acetylglucosamine/UDP-N-acetylgalactosamine diphosphorylase